MDKKQALYLAGAFAAAVSLGLPAKSGIKCKGAALAGQNGCKALDNSHSCAQLSTRDCDPNDWEIAKDRKACEKAKAQCKKEAQQKNKF